MFELTVQAEDGPKVFLIKNGNDVAQEICEPLLKLLMQLNPPLVLANNHIHSNEVDEPTGTASAAYVYSGKTIFNGSQQDLNELVGAALKKDRLSCPFNMKLAGEDFFTGDLYHFDDIDLPTGFNQVGPDVNTGHWLIKFNDGDEERSFILSIPRDKDKVFLKTVFIHLRNEMQKHGVGFTQNKSFTYEAIANTLKFDGQIYKHISASYEVDFDSSKKAFLGRYLSGIVAAPWADLEVETDGKKVVKVSMFEVSRNGDDGELKRGLANLNKD